MIHNIVTLSFHFFSPICKKKKRKLEQVHSFFTAAFTTQTRAPAQNRFLNLQRITVDHFTLSNKGDKNRIMEKLHFQDISLVIF